MTPSTANRFIDNRTKFQLGMNIVLAELLAIMLIGFVVLFAWFAIKFILLQIAKSIDEKNKKE